MTYCIIQSSPKTFEITNFEDHKEPEGTYQVTYTKSNNYFHCDCRGFMMQKDKSAHKHCILVKHWMEQDHKDGLFLDLKDDGSIDHYYPFGLQEELTE